MTLLALMPLIVGCAAAGAIITWPIAEAHGRRSVSDTTRARDAAEVARLARDLYPAAIGPTPVAAIEARTNADAPAVGPAGHRGRHRLTWRRSLVAWWNALPVRDVDAPVRAALAREPELSWWTGPVELPAGPAPLLAIAAGVAEAEGAPELVRRLAADWRVRGTGPIPVVQVFSGDVEPLIGAAA